MWKRTANTGFSRRQMIGAAAALPLAASFHSLAAPMRSMLDMAKLKAIPGALQPFVDKGDVAGMVTMTSYRGEIVQANALGWQDLETRTPMRTDTLFRIASMSKAVTSVAVLILIDEGKINLYDPVTKWIPELANLKVLRAVDGPVEDTVPAQRDITIEDLLTHRAGFGLGLVLAGPIGEAYREAIGSEIGPEVGTRIETADQWLAGLGTLPLLHQPGERMTYSVSTDVLGFLLERIEGKRLQAVFEERIFGPLGMKDTNFWVPPEKRDRLATMYSFDGAQGRLVVAPAADITNPDIIMYGAAGLISTAPDYTAFARMLLGNGQLNGVRLLKPETVLALRTNRLTPAQREHLFLARPLWNGMGFGLGVAVELEQHVDNIFNGSPGSYGWGGGFGTMWMNDPEEDLSYVYLAQQTRMFSPKSGADMAGGRDSPRMGALPTFENLTYGAIGFAPLPMRPY